MEKYQIHLKGIHEGEKLGITYKVDTGEVMIGGKSRLTKPITSVAFDFMRISEDSLHEKSGRRQRNKFRYYSTMTNSDFRIALRRLAYRYNITTAKSVVSFT